MADESLHVDTYFLNGGMQPNSTHLASPIAYNASLSTGTAVLPVTNPINPANALSTGSNNLSAVFPAPIKVEICQRITEPP